MVLYLSSFNTTCAYILRSYIVYFPTGQFACVYFARKFIIFKFNYWFIFQLLFYGNTSLMSTFKLNLVNLLLLDPKWYLMLCTASVC